MAKNLRPDELAEELRVSIKTVRRLIKRGEIEAFKVGATVRIKQDSVEEYQRRKAVRQ